jgi:spore germination protein KB
MIENGKISPLQFGMLVFMFTLGSAALLTPSILTSIVKQDAWISYLLSIIVDISLIFLWDALFKRYPNETMIQFSEHILGKWLGKMIGITYIGFFLYVSALVLRNIGDFISTNILVQTPIQFVHIIFMLTVVYGTYLGLEVITRSSEILLPWVIVIFLITALMLLKKIDLSELMPILPDGWLTPVKGVYPRLGFPISELVVFLMIFPFVNRPNQIKKYFNLSMVFVALFGALIMVMTISVLGVDITARSTFAVFDLAKEIRVGDFFERVEVLVGGIWIMTIFIKLTICFYAANLATGQLFHLKSYRVTILPYGLLVCALSMLVYHNSAEAFAFITGPYPIYSMIYGVFIPACLLVIAKLRKKRDSASSN